MNFDDDDDVNDQERMMLNDDINCRTKNNFVRIFSLV